MSRILLALALALIGCAGSAASTPAGPAAPPPPADPHQQFWADLRALCGRAFDGVIAVNEGGGGAPDPFVGQVLRMHVRACADDEIRVPFHVGDDRSRTWVFTRIPGGVRLKHDHRHPDGSPDALTQYGGDAVGAVAPGGHRFPADASSRALFVREDRAASTTNVWVVAVVPGERFSYALTRPGRTFRVDFDLARPVPAPPPPWGAP